MKKFLPLILSLSFCTASFAQPFFEPFADATASGGTAYSVGDALNTEVNAQALKWDAVGTTATGAAVLITNTTLTMPGTLPAATGNAVLLQNVSGPGGRMTFSTNNTSGVATNIFYSLVMQVNDITALAFAKVNNGGGSFNLGFNNTPGSQSGNPSIVPSALYLGKNVNGDGFLIGTGPNTGANARVWETNFDINPAPHKVGDTIFIVAEYTIVPGVSNDVAQMWINPDPATFGQATNPAPNIIADNAVLLAGGDPDKVQTFVLLNRNTTTPNSMVVDELRIGYSWAAVTSAVAPPPPPVPTLAVSILDPATVQLSWRGDATGFTLQSVGQLLSSGTPWANVSGSPSTSGTNLIQTDTITPGGSAFYRLMKSQ